MVTNGVEALAHCRSALLGIAGGLETAQLDFRLLPDSKSVGEIILHIAGFEYLIISRAQLHEGQEPAHELWQNLKPGFAREAGFTAPRGFPSTRYVDLLAEVRARTMRHFEEFPDRRKIQVKALIVEALTARLSAADSKGEVTAYEKLKAGVSGSIHDDGSVDENGAIDLVSLLTLHETYHRGQITLLKYIYSRLRAERKPAPMRS